MHSRVEPQWLERSCEFGPYERFSAAEGIACALDRAAPGSLYLVTDDHDLTVRELADLVAAALPSRPRVPTVPYVAVWPAALAGSVVTALGLRAPVTLDALRKLTTRLVFSCARARRELGYAPILGVEEGVRRAVADVTRTV